MQVMFNGKEYTTEVNKYGHHTCGGELVSVDGVNIADPRFTLPTPTYTREQILDMLVGELDALGVELGIELTGLKADKQTAILEALGL